MSQKTISLCHINRIGLSEWRNRERWSRCNVRIWSGEHRLWWRTNACGYTDDKQEAWVIDFPTAYEHTRHCGPEKKISYCTVPRAASATVSHRDDGSSAQTVVSSNPPSGEKS